MPVSAGKTRLNVCRNWRRQAVRDANSIPAVLPAAGAMTTRPDKELGLHQDPRPGDCRGSKALRQAARQDTERDRPACALAALASNAPPANDRSRMNRRRVWNAVSLVISLAATSSGRRINICESSQANRYRLLEHRNHPGFSLNRRDPPRRLWPCCDDSVSRVPGLALTARRRWTLPAAPGAGLQAQLQTRTQSAPGSEKVLDF